MKILKLVKSKLPYLLLVMMILGVANGYYNNVKYLKSFVTPTLFLMVYPMMINMKVTDLFEGFSKPKPLILSILINFTLSPIIAFGLTKIFFNNYPMLTVGLILIALIPTSGMTASWTGLAKGNLKSALLMISANLLLSIVMIPFYMKLFLGELVAINTLSIVKSLIQVVIIPLILGDITRRFIIKRYGMEGYKKVKPQLSGVSSIGVLVIVFIAMSLKSKTIINESELLLLSIVPLVLYYSILLFISNFIGKKYLDNGNKIALVYGTTMRNLTISLGISISAFGDSLAVFLIAISYMIQLPMAAFYMHRVSNKELPSPDANPNNA